MNDFFELGRVLKPQGIRGELKTELYTDDLERVDALPYVFTGDSAPLQKIGVRSARTDGRFAYLVLDGISDRNAAEKMRGAALYIDRANAAPIPEGAFYISDLVGLPVSTDEGVPLGVLKDILQTGAADVYVVERTDDDDLLFPAADGVFVERSPEAGRIIVSAARLSEVAEL